MKKNAAIAAFAMLFAFFVAGCKEKENSEASKIVESKTSEEAGVVTEAVNETVQMAEPVQIQEEISQDIPEENVPSTMSGVVLFSGWTYCAEKNGVMVSAAQAETGDSVLICTENGAPIEKEAVQRFADGTSAKYEFVKILVDSNEYWTRKACVSKGGKVSVALEDGYLFTATDIAMMDKRKVKAGQLLVTFPGNDEFEKVVVYDAKAPYGLTRYVLKPMVSTDSLVIDTMITKARIKEYASKKPADQLKPVVLEEVSELIGGI